MAKLANQHPTEHESYWSLPFKGLRIIQLRIDHSFGMEIGDTDRQFSLRINTPFKLKAPEDIADYTTERLSEIGGALRLFDAVVVDAKAFKNGHLEMSFSNGIIVSVDPDTRFEPWEVVGNSENGMRIVAMPGGELVVWSGSGLES